MHRSKSALTGIQSQIEITVPEEHFIGRLFDEFVVPYELWPHNTLKNLALHAYITLAWVDDLNWMKIAKCVLSLRVSETIPITN